MGDDEKGSPDINSELTMTAAQIADAASIDEWPTVLLRTYLPKLGE